VYSLSTTRKRQHQHASGENEEQQGQKKYMWVLHITEVTKTAGQIGRTKTVEEQAAAIQTKKTQIRGLDKWTTPSERKRF
jgi:hypothetical protein